MKTEYLFKSNETLLKLAKETARAKEFYIPFEQETVLTPRIELVSDWGVYVMDSYAGKDDEENIVCYAEGFSESDHEEEIGGDDFVESIPLTTKQLDLLEKGGDLLITFTDEEILIEVKA